LVDFQKLSVYGLHALTVYMHIDTGNYIINKTNTDNIRWWNIV